jgi:polyisoprenoid-binding protein YceI
MRTLAGLLLCAWGVRAESYTIRPEAQGRFALEVAKTGIMSGKVHVFEYANYSGRLEYDAAHPEAAKLEFSIVAESLVCKDTWVDDKDKKKVVQVALDMMQHANHPSMDFASTAVSKRADGGFDVRGTLTVKGIAKPVVVVVSVKAEGAALVFAGKATVLRKDYKINPPSPVPFGLIGNKDEMPVSFTLVARKAG